MNSSATAAIAGTSSTGSVAWRALARRRTSGRDSEAGADPPAIRRYFSQEHRAARLGAAAQLICADCLARFSGSVAALARRAGRGSPGLAAASMAGGALAATSLGTSALITATLTTGRAERDADANELYRLMFVTGGPVHGVGLALLVGSLGLAGLRTGELPRRP